MFPQLIKLLKKYFYIFLTNILKSGPVPHHIGLLTDGNRRWCDERGYSYLVGHAICYGKTLELIDYCLKIGTKELSFYYIGFHNLRRSEQELMNLLYSLEDLYCDFVKRPYLLMDRGVKIKIHGDMDCWTHGTKQALSKLVLMTKDNKNMVFNMVHLYSSRDALRYAVSNLVQGVQKGIIAVTDITEELVGQSQYVSDLPGVDIILRTSGVYRTSDFLSWHLDCTQFKFFDDVLWPDFTFWHFYQVVRKFQLGYHHARKVQEEMERIREDKMKSRTVNEERVVKYIKDLEDQRDRQYKQNAESRIKREGFRYMNDIFFLRTKQFEQNLL